MKNRDSMFQFRLFQDDRGFSLAELIVIIVVMGIMAAAAGVAINSVNQNSRISVAANNALSDMRYAQEIAMAERKDVNFTVNTDTNTYSATYTSTGTYLKSSQNESANMTVTLNSGDTKGVTMSGGYSGSITFDSDGIPYQGATELTAPLTLMTLNGKMSLVLLSSGFAQIE